MRLELFMGLRYLKAKRKQTFISLITWISVGGVAIGVMTLIVVLSVMTGMQNEVRDKILGTYSHLIVLSYNSSKLHESNELLKLIESHKKVKAASPYIHGEVLISSPSRSTGAIFRGIDPARAGKVSEIARYMREGSVDKLSEQFQDGDITRDAIVIGDELASLLSVSVGDVVSVYSPRGRATAMGMAPKISKFHVAGLFHSGMFEYDSGMVFVSVKTAQRFFSMEGKISGIEVRVTDIYAAREIGDDLQAMIGFPYYARDWMEMNENLFYAFKLEKTAIFIIIVLIIFVAAFNIVSTMIMVVMEKGRDIAILKTMGASRGMVMRIFFLEGFIIGLAGTVIGNVLGFIVCTALDKYEIIKLPSDVYSATTLAVEMNPMDFVIISACAVTITLISAVYPAWNASRQDPVEALRYE